MRENTIAVIMFCGPRTPDGFAETVRIRRATDLALSERTSLYIVGDDHGGEDVARYASMAREHSRCESTVVPRGKTIDNTQTITKIVPVLNVSAEANTWTNAQAVAKEIASAGLLEVYLVTEAYHMPRAKLLLEHALRDACKRHAPKVTEAPVVSAIPTPIEILAAENRKRKSVGIQEMIESPNAARRRAATAA